MMNEPSVNRPAPIRVGKDNAFADHTMAVRVPGIIRQVQALNPDYPAPIMRRLDALHDALAAGAQIPMLPLTPTPLQDYADWQAAYEAQQCRSDRLTWQHSEWFFAETLCYCHLIDAVRWFETGRDPFAIPKREELASPRFAQLLAAALDVDGAFEEKLGTLLLYSLWGNRVDLSHPAGDLAADAGDDDLLVDDRAALLETLRAQPPGGTIHLIADNAGSELAMDLLLIDLLLAGGTRSVMLHVKAFPTFVSDTTIPDIPDTLHVLETHGARPAALVERLRRAWDDGRWTWAAHPFWTSSRFLWEMPPALRALFAQADVVIQKGDALYRRAVGDTVWPADTSFASALNCFPAPFAALRSSKSDASVGLPQAVTQRLDHERPGWRVGGAYGMIQFAAGTRQG